MHDPSLHTHSDIVPRGDRQACDVRLFVDERLAAHSKSLFDETQLFVERYLISRVLLLTGGNQSKAALILGITRGSLRNKIHAQGITIDQIVRDSADARSASGSELPAALPRDDNE